jgi:Cu2+-exporting ATPase
MTGTRNLSHFVRHLDGGVARIELEVDGLLRAGCTQAIEGSLAAIPDITLARVSVADRRVAVEWRDGKVDPVRFIDRLSELGFEAHPCNVQAADATPPVPALLICLGVAALGMAVVGLAAGVAPGNPFHWVPAAIALAAAAWAGRPFFMATVRAAAAGRVSREAPIAAAVLFAFGLSVAGSLNPAGAALYDWALAPLVLALALRALEAAVLPRAPAAAAFAPADVETVTKFVSDTELSDVPAAAVRPGDLVLVRPGERIAVDGVVADGRSEVDQSRVTGETLPVSVARDSAVYAGTVNVSGTLRVKAGAAGRGALLDGVLRVDGGDAAGPARVSGRAIHLHPAVAFVAALATFAAWMAFGAAWHDAATAAMAVLVTACPAMPGLAAGAVDARAARALATVGVRLTSAGGIERLARVDTILFDKTGTLTMPEPEVVNAADIPPERLALAGRLALASRHPLASAVVRAARATTPVTAIEEPGQGIRCFFQGVPLRLGRPSFCDAERRASAILQTDPEASVIAFAYGEERHALAVRQRLRSDAIETVARLKQDGFAIEIVSGDRAPAVCHAAETLGIERWQAGMTPADKTGHIRVLQARGHAVLMVGDGLNDAPPLAAADAAMTVDTAVPFALAAADAVFAGDRLAPVAAAIAIARLARRLRRQNLSLAAAFTAAAVLVAALGLAGPLAAALAMAGVAAAVTLNALRLKTRQPY